jgi:hypothetical protein
LTKLIAKEFAKECVVCQSPPHNNSIIFPKTTKIPPKNKAQMEKWIIQSFSNRGDQYLLTSQDISEKHEQLFGKGLTIDEFSKFQFKNITVFQHAEDIIIFQVMLPKPNLKAQRIPQSSQKVKREILFFPSFFKISYIYIFNI